MKDPTARRMMPLNILETSDSRKEEIARSAAGIEGRMCKSRFLSGATRITFHRPPKLQIDIKEFAILRKIFRLVGKQQSLLYWPSPQEWSKGFQRTCYEKERNQGFLGGSPSYMVGDFKQIEWRSGCLLVYNDINASVYPLLYYSPFLSVSFSVSFWFHAFSPWFPHLCFLFVSSLSQFLLCMHKRSRVQSFATRIISSVSLRTYNKIVKRHRVPVLIVGVCLSFTWIIRFFIAVISLLFSFNCDSLPSRNETLRKTKSRRDVGCQQFSSRCIALFPFSIAVKIVRNLPPRGDFNEARRRNYLAELIRFEARADPRRTRRTRSITLAPRFIDGGDYFA